MSRWIVSKADIDAYVTIALRWTERGEVAALPEPARTALTVTRETASDVGQRLWLANTHPFMQFHSDLGPGEWEEVQEVRDWWDSVTPYQFEEFLGDPAPETAYRRASYYSYQSAYDEWEEWPFEAVFTTSMKWYALRQLGLVSSPTLPTQPFFNELNIELAGRPIYDGSGWLLAEEDRDLFLRLA